MFLLAATIFSSAFLLFLVQPIIAKQILPWFGGSAVVWTTCMVFFQFALLFGYAYSDGMTRRLRPRTQLVVHVGLLAASVAALPILPDAGWKPAGGENPAVRIALLLTVTIGLPYFLLSTTGPLVQAWFARAYPAGSVYRLFALSNAASLLALIAYPLAIEPFVSTRAQSVAWSAAYGVFAVLCAGSAISSLRRAGAAPAGDGASLTRASGRPAAVQYLLWLILAAMGSFMLLAVTGHITQDIASVPFLWIVPLTLYLVTFILCFEGRGWYRRWPVLVALGAVLCAMAWALHGKTGLQGATQQILLYCAGLFVCCMFYHGELAARKPPPQHLTAFYLVVSLGGALGGLTVGVAAPLLFNGPYELGLGLIATGLLAACLLRRLPRWVPAVAVGVTLVAGYHVYRYYDYYATSARKLTRNFYGTLRIIDTGPAHDDAARRQLTHGVILHGEQFLAPSRRGLPTTYYGPDSGIGVTLHYFEDRPVSVGAVGLGTGTVAAYSKPGDHYRFYELNPQVIRIAREDFFFLSESRARVEIVPGDARLSLEREPPNGFDVLLLDAFSSDAIPVHLVTREALELYLKHMSPDGVILFHITSRHIDLAPVLERLARERQLRAVRLGHWGDASGPFRYQVSDYVLITRNEGFLRSPRIAAVSTPIEPRPGWRAWTDDYNNVLQVLR